MPSIRRRCSWVGILCPLRLPFLLRRLALRRLRSPCPISIWRVCAGGLCSLDIGACVVKHAVLDQLLDSLPYGFGYLAAVLPVAFILHTTCMTYGKRTFLILSFFSDCTNATPGPPDDSSLGCCYCLFSCAVAVPMKFAMKIFVANTSRGYWCLSARNPSCKNMLTGSYLSSAIIKNRYPR